LRGTRNNIDQILVAMIWNIFAHLFTSATIVVPTNRKK